MPDTDFEPTDEPLRERLAGWTVVVCIVTAGLLVMIGIQRWQENNAERREAEVQVLQDLDVEIISEPDLMWNRYVIVAGTCTVNVEFEEDTLEFGGSDIRSVTTPRDTTSLPDVAGLEGCY